MNNFTNPYINGEPAINISKEDSDISKRVTFSVHVSDKDLLRLTRPSNGTETTVCTILYRKFCNLLRSRGVDNVTKSSDLEECAANVELVWKTKQKKVK